MNTINYYARISDNLASMGAGIESLAYIFANETARTPLDEDLIDALIAYANETLAAAAALKTIEYNPAPEG